MSQFLLCPSPKTVCWLGGLQQIPFAWALSLAEGFTERLRRAVERSLPCQPAPDAMPIRFHKDASMPTGAYRLAVNRGHVEVVSGDEAGGFYALQTLQQILRQPNPLFQGQFPIVEIEDAPAIAHRGVMLDISRCKVPSMQTLRQLADMLSSFKINQIQLYTEHTFAYAGHEIVWGDASPLTAQEVREFVAYCADRYIEVVPNQNAFGHMERWLRYPEYQHLAECPSGFEFRWGGRSPWGTTLKPDQESLDFAEGLFAELLPNFTSREINIGCDETWELGLGWSRKLCAEKGKHRVYFEHLCSLGKVAEKMGYRTQFWADILLEEPELVSELPQNMIGMVWGYEASHPFASQCERFAKTKVPFYVCPGTSSWNSIGGRLDNALANLENAAQNAIQHGAIGYLNTDWGDGGHHQFLPISYPPFVAGAALSWNPVASLSETMLVSILNTFVFQDSSNAMGAVLVSLGKIRNCFKKQINNSHPLANLVFLPTPSIDIGLKHVTTEELADCLEKLDTLRCDLAETTAKCGDAALIKEEISVAIGLLRHACSRTWHHSLGQYNRSTPLRKELTPLIGRFEACWVARNRMGGLHESSNRLRNVLASY